MTSVRVKVMSGDDSSSAAARTCPMKPAAPVMRIASFCDIVRPSVVVAAKILNELNNFEFSQANHRISFLRCFPWTCDRR